MKRLRHTNTILIAFGKCIGTVRSKQYSKVINLCRVVFISTACKKFIL